MNSDLEKQHALLIGAAYAHVGEGRFAEARDAFYQALQLLPATAAIFQSLGGCCFECGQIEEAIAHMRASLALNPENPVANEQLGICCLLLGHAEPGWSGLAYRKKHDPLPIPAPPPAPEWNGEPLHGAGIVVLHEQGFGDGLQFVRYGPQIKARGGTVYFDVLKPLRRLLAAQPDLGIVLQSGQQVRIATYVYCMDLPRLFGDGPQGPREAAPYIRLPADARVPQLADDDTGSFRVGLAWAGSAIHGRDRQRSVSLEMLRPLLQVANCQFFSLLIGTRAQDVGLAGLQDHVQDLSGQIEDFLDLAAVIEKMDLVITVDTAVAHLAGAMCKPVWVLLCNPPDWRWGYRGARTAWYSSMRLFRQQTPGDWSWVIEQVTKELSRCSHRNDARPVL